MQGFVSRTDLSRKHVKGNVNQVDHLAFTENGITGTEEREQFSKVTRIHYDRPDPEGDKPLIGGIGLEDQYKTNYMSQTLGEGTDRSQLSLIKRTQRVVIDPSKSIVHKNEQVQNKSVQFKDSFPATQSGSNERNTERFPPQSKSLIANISDSLLDLKPPPRTRKTKH